MVSKHCIGSCKRPNLTQAEIKWKLEDLEI